LKPARQDILGFTNRWYPLAIDTAQVVDLVGTSMNIRLVCAPAFIATQLEAYWGRGRGDFLASHDLEDVVTVIDGRETLHHEVAQAPTELRQYLAKPPMAGESPLNCRAVYVVHSIA
jgi:hypothetical protein